MGRVFPGIIALMIIFSAGAGSAAIRYVRTDGTNSGNCTSPATPCLSIQYAIDRAINGSTDTIRIASGTYIELLEIPSTFPGSLTIHLSGGWNDGFTTSCNSAPTRLTGPDSDQSLIKMFNNSVFNTVSLDLSCLSFQGNSLTNPAHAVRVVTTSQNTFNLSLDKCEASLFPGNAIRITANAGSLVNGVFSNVTIKNNSALINGNLSGIGLYAEADGVNTKLNLTFDNSRILDNVGDLNANGGGGISLNARNRGKLIARMVNTIIAGNQNKYFGGGVAVGSSDGTTGQSELELDMINCTINNNRTRSVLAGGGLSVYADGTSKTTVRLKNSIVRENHNYKETDYDIYLWENALNDSATVALSAGYSILASVYNEQDMATFTDSGHNLMIDPRLNSISHLSGGSPAIDAGQCGYYFLSKYIRVAPEKDIDNQYRPGWGVLTGCDIGADEYYDNMLCFPVRTPMETTATICL